MTNKIWKENNMKYLFQIIILLLEDLRLKAHIPK
jgi:hypothetical protein